MVEEVWKGQKTDQTPDGDTRIDNDASDKPSELFLPVFQFLWDIRNCENANNPIGHPHQKAV